MVETITQKSHPDFWQLILKISPDYPHKETRLWNQDYKGLVGRYLSQGFMCTYYLVKNSNIKRIPDKPDDDSPTEFLDIPPRTLVICTGVHPKGISIIDIYSNSP